MTETRTCARCAREGTRMFTRRPNTATGVAQWECTNKESCRYRTWRSPCTHYAAHVGTVAAGDLGAGPHCSVSTCRDCVPACREHVTRVTDGLPAGELILFGKAVTE